MTSAQKSALTIISLPNELLVAITTAAPESRRGFVGNVQISIRMPSSESNVGSTTPSSNTSEHVDYGQPSVTSTPKSKITGDSHINRIWRLDIFLDTERADLALGLFRDTVSRLLIFSTAYRFRPGMVKASSTCCQR
ncbi:hypothetical protein B0H13DRAFT_2078757, partial [Mycena leptocephala]